MTTVKVDYVASARRHLKDADILMGSGRQANAGQLFGFTVECGLKALLIASGFAPDSEGGITTPFRKHMPKLNNELVLSGHLIPDGPRAAHYLAMVRRVGDLNDWSTDHRYFKESALPLASLTKWGLAAREMNEILDQAVVDGVM
jgi:hypothetical protein